MIAFPHSGAADNLFHEFFGTCRVSVLGRLLSASDKLADMLGYSAASELMANAPDAPFKDPSFRTSLMDRYLDEGGIINLDTHWVRKNGSPLPVRLNGRLSMAEAGEPAFTLIVQDTTKKMDGEEALREPRWNDAIERLSAGVTHDLKGLMMVIRGNLSLLALDASLSPSARQYLDQIETASSSSIVLLRRLLEGAVKRSAPAAAIDLNQILAESKDVIGKLLGREIGLEINTLDKALWVDVPRDKLDQLILNLVFNARDAMPEGGFLALDTRLAARPQGAHRDRWTLQGVMLTVTDNGAGMDAMTRERIFEPFFSTKSGTPNSGLGLSIVADIVQEAGGTIRVTSEPGDGTTFDIWLPLSRASRGQSGATGTAAPERRRHTVLLAAHHEGAVFVAREALQRKGYRVLSALSTQSALDIWDSHGPVDLLVTDPAMPPMNGLALADHLQARNPKLTVVYVSGDCSEVARNSGTDPAHPIPLGQHPDADSDLGDCVSRLLTDSTQRSSNPFAGLRSA